MMTALNTTIEAGDELTFDLEGEADGVGDDEMTVEVARIDDGKMFVVDEDGTEFGYVTETGRGLDEDAQLRHTSGQLIGRCYNVTIEGREDDLEQAELENDIEAKKEALEAAKDAGREDDIERLEDELAELEGEDEETDGGVSRVDAREHDGGTKYADAYGYETVAASEHDYDECPNCKSDQVVENDSNGLAIECAGCGHVRGEPLDTPTLEDVQEDIKAQLEEI